MEDDLRQVTRVDRVLAVVKADAFKRLVGTREHSSDATMRSAQNRAPQSRPSGRTPRASLMWMLALLAASLAAGSSAQHQLSPTSSSTASPSVGSTHSQSEPIKWSFGGWAPLNGMPSGRQNATGATVLKGTTPLPPTIPNAIKAASSSRQQPANSTTSGHQARESLSESASSSHERLQFTAPQSDISAATRHHHIHSGPAYAMVQPAIKPQQFSPPAPNPIVRDHLLPLANHARYQQQQPPAVFNAPMQHLQRAPPMAASHLQPQHHSMPPPHQNPTRQLMHQDPLHHVQQPQHHAQHQQQQQAFYQQMEARHRQQMMHHQQQMAKMHHQTRYRYGPHQHPMMPMHQTFHHQRPPYHLDQQPQPQQQPQQAPRPQPPGRLMQSYQIFANQQAQQVPQVGSYKVVNGEQPIMFTHSLSNERIPMIEVGGNQAPNSTYPQQQRPAENPVGPSTPSPVEQSVYSPTMAAIDKENLNYQNALNQVTSSFADEQQQQQQQYSSNNIQEIKEKQQHEQQQQQQHKQQQHADKTSGSKPSYLTIPVAIETDGDKVLTSDDINEIEKHVINALPNLKTASNIVKIADAHLSSANLKEAVEKHNINQSQQQQQQTNGPELHRQNYEEHRSTMKQLAIESGNPSTKQPYGTSSTNAMQQPQQHFRHHQSTTASTDPSPNSYSSAAASAPGAQHNEAPTQVVHEVDPKQIEHQYFVATGPLQEVGTVDPDQLSDYNLIKNDLLNTFRYEPTRATPTSGDHQHHNQQSPSSTTGHHYRDQQTASTPPMQPSSSSRPYGARPAGSSRYFQRDQQRQFGRVRSQQYQPSATTKTILGGRKVSEVMRHLIHTTPVPMSSPMHVPSVEPEKVDAIQLIAGQANDKSPMVVEAHQLVSHTPDGGIDYNSGGQQQEAQFQHQNQNQTVIYEAQQPQQHHQAPPQQQDAIIEYVALADPSQQQQQSDAGDTRTYDYSVSNSQGDGGATPAYVTIAADPALIQAAVQEHQEQQQHQQTGAAQPSLAWSPSVASEHQQQQVELSGHTAPQMDMPATAGYNFYQDQQQQQHDASAAPLNNESGAQDNQEQSMAPASRWRTKAGGSQPNPDAQYDGQIVKGSPEQDGSAENNQQQVEQQQQVLVDENQQQQPQQSNYGNQQQADELTRLSERPTIQEQIETDNVQHTYQDQAPTTTTVGDQQQSTRDGYLSTNSFVGGAQMNHQRYRGRPQQAPSDGYGDEGQQQSPQNGYEPTAARSQSAPSIGQIAYMKLDNNRQQNHLTQHQQQHQAQMAEIMQSQQPSYQTTTPMTLTTLAAVIEQQQEANAQHEQQAQLDLQDPAKDQQQDQQRTEQSTGTGGEQEAGYQTDQVHSRPSVQSQPESLVINESPIQVPIMDQQSLISDPNEDSAYETSGDDGPKQQRLHSQPDGVYQVYQAYYAPKDHKPLPGYVRLSLEEFNELFRDAEIQYVDRSLNGLNQKLNNAQSKAPTENMISQQQQAYGADQMKASASDVQSILVDGRSISPNDEADQKTKLGQAVKKIISIRNSRHLAKQTKTSKLVMKRVKPQTLTQVQSTTPMPPSSTTTASATITSPDNPSKVSKKKKADVSAKRGV